MGGGGGGGGGGVAGEPAHFNGPNFIDPGGD